MLKPKNPVGPIVQNPNARIPLDENHRLLGLRLYTYRMTVKHQTTTQLHQQIGWSQKKIRNAEQGHLVFNLFDLATMAEYLETTPSELLKEWL